jgi:GDP-4-dehydro-6-deoxy-D-mannose reductase
VSRVRAFLTGGHGFVGRFLAAHLQSEGDSVDVAPLDVDITDLPALRQAVVSANADAIYHLAAFTHVGQSWQEPEATLRVNVLGALNVTEAARACQVPPRVLLVGSAEVYGAVSPRHLPVSEDAPLRPVSPYAASKAAAELVGLQAHLGRGVPVIRVRPFNHAGPGQDPGFVVSGLAQRIVKAEREGSRTIAVGNLSARRDFTDVRDVVRAYRLLVERGVAGEVYNVCSGRDVAIEALARRLIELAGADVALSFDRALFRPADVPALRGDPTRLREATGWEPQIALDDTLRAVIDHWRTSPP